MTSYQYRKSHCGDKTILWPSYLHNGISYTGKITSLYWIRALVPSLYFLMARLWLVTELINLTLQMTVLLIFVSLLCLSACEVLNIECFLHIFFWWYAFIIRFLWSDKSLGVLIPYTKWTGIWRVVVLWLKDNSCYILDHAQFSKNS